MTSRGPKADSLYDIKRSGSTIKAERGSPQRLVIASPSGTIEMSSSGPRGRGPRGAIASGARGTRGGSSSIAASIRGLSTSATGTCSTSHTPLTSGTNTPTLGRAGKPGTTFGAASGGQSSGYSGPNTGVIGITDKSGRIDPLTDPSDRCPNCKTDRFLNPRLKLLVSPCYHKLCTSCIDRIWSLGPAPCPECGNVCRKSQFGSQTFADLAVEREVDIRKRVARIFGAKGQEDFSSLREYNDYLEQAELLTSNLILRVDLEATNAQLARLEAESGGGTTRSGKGHDDGTSAASSGEALALVDSRLLTLRQERLARRRAQDLEDAQLKKDEEDEIVTALEDGLDKEDIMAIQDRFKRRREELEAVREAQEAEDVRREEQLRREAFEAAMPASKRGDATKAAAKKAPEWRPDCLLLFDGSFAECSAGHELLAAIPTNPIQDLTSDDLNTWIPYDPWLKSWLVALPQEERDKYRAGGYDVADYWRRQMLVAVSSLGVTTTFQ